MAFSDAPDREAAWLNSSGDGLPALGAANGGPFQIIQARWPRAENTNKRAIYVLRTPANGYSVKRFAAQRSMASHRFTLRLNWRLTSGQGAAEADQLAFEEAIDLVLARIEDVLGDHTHGGRFQEAGEDGITVTDYDPVRDMQSGIFRAAIQFSADDPDFPN